MFLTGERKSIFMLVTKKKWELFFCMPSCLIMFHMISGMASCNFFFILLNLAPVQCIEAYDTSVGAFAQYEILKYL